jgi:hypothetical protein
MSNWKHRRINEEENKVHGDGQVIGKFVPVLEDHVIKMFDEP